MKKQINHVVVKDMEPIPAIKAVLAEGHTRKAAEMLLDLYEKDPTKSVLPETIGFVNLQKLGHEMLRHHDTRARLFSLLPTMNGFNKSDLLQMVPELYLKHILRTPEHSMHVRGSREHEIKARGRATRKKAMEFLKHYSTNPFGRMP
jgi:hypothetical protein